MRWKQDRGGLQSPLERRDVNGSGLGVALPAFMLPSAPSGGQSQSPQPPRENMGMQPPFRKTLWVKPPYAPDFSLVPKPPFSTSGSGISWLLTTLKLAREF